MADKAMLSGSWLRRKLLEAFHKVINEVDDTFINRDDETCYGRSSLYIIHADNTFYVLADVRVAANPQQFPNALVTFGGSYIDEKTFLAAANSLNGEIYTADTPDGKFGITYKFTISNTDIKTEDQPETRMDGLQSFLDDSRNRFLVASKQQPQQHANVKFMLKVTPECLNFWHLSEKNLPENAEARLAKLQEIQAAQLAQLANLKQQTLDLNKAIAFTAEKLKELSNAA
jgi:hypothetical protein